MIHPPFPEEILRNKLVGSVENTSRIWGEGLRLSTHDTCIPHAHTGKDVSTIVLLSFYLTFYFIQEKRAA